MDSRNRVPVHEVLCPNPKCRTKRGNIVRAGWTGQEPRFRCTNCGGTFNRRPPLFRGMRYETADRLPRVVADYCRGNTIRGIAADQGVSPASVTRWLNRAVRNLQGLRHALREQVGLPEDEIDRCVTLVVARSRSKARLSGRRRRLPR